MTCEVINFMRGIEDKTYLELGIGKGQNFAAIKSKRKLSVDVNGRAGFRGTTDEFFSQCGDSRWDIIFIDANHDYQFVLRDFNNSVGRCNEWVIIHDMIPPSEKYTAQHFCSDSYRLLYLLLQYKGLKIYPMKSHFGMTFIKMPFAPIFPVEDFSLTDYGVFKQHMKGVRLYSEDEIKEIITR